MTDAPRTALVAHRLAAPNASGIDRYVREFVRAVAAQLPAGRLAVGSAPEAEPVTWLPAGVDYRVLPGPRAALHAGWLAANRPRVDRALGSPDVVHVASPYLPVPARAPTVVTVHDLTPLKDQQWYTRLERVMFARAMNHAVRHAAKLIVISKTVADEVADRYRVDADRMVVIPQGVAEVFRRPVDPAAAAAACERYGVAAGEYLVFVGAVSHRKNVGLLAQLMGRLGPDSPPLLCIGPDGVGAEAIHAAVAAQQLGTRLRFAGRVSDDDLVALVAGARALLHPAFDEGFGMTPLEAMAAGTATVVSDAGSLPEVVGDASLRADPHDVDAWVAAVEEIVGDDRRHQQLVDAGRARAAEFTWANTAACAIATYRCVVGGGDAT